MVSSAVPISRAPLGAQYSPVLSMEKLSMKSAVDFAASSGLTAVLISDGETRVVRI